ncbi:hypothetical protein D7Y21_39955 [Corallococcus sp. AB045]|uniref:hypothetical protein n=1 Tax=Corallococcus sp. AB045 TaxID=2316719 RepID=UPI000ED2D1A9|nr:hypothetical protein [Corallococcus sp. AB045]RKH75769.1 hypothetical protein D7Y21_39955 [Corallococcus sp. AB045]
MTLQLLKTVIMPVEFHCGRPRTVRIARPVQNSVSRRIEFLRTDIIPVASLSVCLRTVRLERPAKAFAKLRPEFWSTPTELTLPTDQFRYDKIVPDAAIAICRSTQPHPLPKDRAPSGQGNAIVVLLESPHEKEYGPNFTPLGPLQRRSSRTRLRKQLPRLLQEAGLSWAAVGGSEVILANPVQLQASLHRLMQLDWQTGVQDGVRNQVWRALYYLPEIHYDFIRRIGLYRPALVLNACTDTLRDEVQTTLKALPYPARQVNHHPSYWSASTIVI